MRRRTVDGRVRLRLAADYRVMAGIARGVDPIAEAAYLRVAERVDAGLPVVVQRGSDIDVSPPHSGPWCVETDGSVTAVEPVYVDPVAPIRTVRRYRRLDGSVI